MVHSHVQIQKYLQVLAQYKLKRKLSWMSRRIHLCIMMSLAGIF